jgi:hypothetical protein
MKKTKLVVAALAGLCLTAGQAFAQEEGDTEGEEVMEGDGEGTGDDGTGDTTAAPDDGMGEEPDMAGAAGLAGYPQAVIDRPRVLPKGVLEARADLAIAYLKIGDSSSTGIGLGLSARYGLAPKIDATLGYSFALKEFEIKGDLAIGAAYSLTESDKMGVAVRVDTGINLNGVNDEGESAVKFGGVALGLDLIYRVTPKIGIGTRGGHLVLGFADGVKPISFGIPVQVEFQANEKINAFLGTQVANIAISPSEGTAVFGRDGLPLTIGGTFSPSNKLDIGLQFVAPDLEFVADFFAINLHAAMRM